MFLEENRCPAEGAFLDDPHFAALRNTDQVADELSTAPRLFLTFCLDERDDSARFSEFKHILGTNNIVCPYIPVDRIYRC